MCRILVVDDESLVLALLDRVLREAGYETLLARSGEEAVGLAQRDASRVDLLVTDLKMPGISGQETAAQISTLKPALPVIYMSGFCDRAAAGLNAMDGASAFIAKPFSRHALLSAVGAMLDSRPSYSGAVTA